MSGQIVGEYEDYSLYETGLSEEVTVIPQLHLPSGIIPGHTFQVASTQTILVSSYADALLEPEWEIFQ